MKIQNTINKIEAFNELDIMDIKIKNDIDDKEEIYNSINNKYDINN